MTESQRRFYQALIVLLGLFAFAVVLAFHNITDGDLWAKLAIGSELWNTGHLPRHDLYAFTPTLPQYIDHEWGAGVVFYALLQWFGPSSLIVLRIVLAAGLLAMAFFTGRRQECDGAQLDAATKSGRAELPLCPDFSPDMRAPVCQKETSSNLKQEIGAARQRRPTNVEVSRCVPCDANILFLLAIPAAACLLTGYIPVARSHVFTFFLFAATLFCLEELRRGGRWPAFVLPVLILVWANLHGGFVVGLGAIFVCCAASIVKRNRISLMIFIAVACVAVTLINPYGLDFWRYLIPALLHPRLRIQEWRPLPPLAWDDFWGFRLLFVLTIIAAAAGWKRVERKNWAGLVVLAVMAVMGWRSRRHGPFLGAAALAYAGPYFQAVWRGKFQLLPATVVLYTALAFWVAIRFLPGASLYPISPIGEDPVREVDILALAGAKGNAATPFAWGSYVSWRLYPKVKISMDGRYETTFPESTFELNNAFYDHQGDWLQLCREFKVDYVILDLQAERLRPEALQAAGYALITNVDNVSALLCLQEHAPMLLKAARDLPTNYTMDPFDLSAKKGR